MDHGPGFIDGLEKMDRYSYRLYRSFNNFKSRQLLVFLFGSLYHNFFFVAVNNVYTKFKLTFFNR